MWTEITRPRYEREGQRHARPRPQPLAVLAEIDETEIVLVIARNEGYIRDVFY
jgi:hypothetical protein